MNNYQNEKSFSAMEQIKCISLSNAPIFVDKKELKSDVFNDIVTLINKFDNKVVDNRNIYDSILVPWKINATSDDSVL